MDLKWNFKGLPPSDPYKRYLVVYCPWDYSNNRYDTFHIRFDIAEHYTGDGMYKDAPWHFDITHSAEEREIIAWADIGDASDFKKYLTPYSLLETLKKNIADFKWNIHCENTDYMTGYLCALSAVEGMIAEVEE